MEASGAPVRHTEDELRAVTVGEPERGPVHLAEYDPAWPVLFEREAARIRQALGDRVLGLEHVGSTSVPGLAAKPIIDIALMVASSADEGAYAPELEAAGYALRVREPGWLEHRMFRGMTPRVNLHVYSSPCAEVDRMLAFRDRLRDDDADRRLYEAEKRALSRRPWTFVQEYADAKTEVVAEIMRRAGLPRPGTK